MEETYRDDVSPETFYDIQEDATWTILRMMPQLILVYALSVGLLGTVVVFVVSLRDYNASISYFGGWWVFLVSAGLGLVLALVHALMAYLRPLDKFTDNLGAEPLDREDHYHSTFENVVEEISLAAPVDYVSARVIPTPRTNVLAAGDREVAELMITEGALGQLRRDELQAVVAHELAHVAYGDSRLKMFTANILRFFEILDPDVLLKARRSGSSGRVRPHGRGALLVFVLAVLSPALKGINKIFATGLSLHREWRADATAIEYSRNPLALARALYRLGDRRPDSVPVGSPGPLIDYRDSVSATAYNQLLFVPFDSASQDSRELSWWDRLFLTHPPLENRVEKALDLAKVSYTDFKNQVEKQRSSPPLDLRALRDEAGDPLHNQSWWVYENGEERGINLVDLLTGEELTGESLIAREGDEQWSRPEEHDEFRAISKLYDGETEPGKCPECGAPFCRRFYLGVPIKVCLMCGGVALSWRKVIRLETRHRDGKLPDRLGEVEDYSGYHGGEPIPEAEVTEGQCPECEEPFRAKRYHASELVVDQCPLCKFTWFEEDELTIALNL